MNFQGKRIKIISVLIVGILLSANFEAIKIKAEASSNYLGLTSNINIDNISNTENRFLEDKMKKQKSLNPIIKQFLLREDIDIDLRYYMATKVSELEGNDLSILFLMTHEISKIFKGQVKQFHNGFLVENSRNWAILVEHGRDLTSSKECLTLVENLAKEYTYVVLASCDSYFLSTKYRNVDGFSGEVSFGIILKYLSAKLVNNKERLSSVLASQIYYYTLYVEEAQFSDLSHMLMLISMEMVSLTTKKSWVSMILTVMEIMMILENILVTILNQPSLILMGMDMVTVMKLILTYRMIPLILQILIVFPQLVEDCGKIPIPFFYFFIDLMQNKFKEAEVLEI